MKRSTSAAGDIVLISRAESAEAQQAQVELTRKQRALDEEKRELDLTVEKRVQASVADIRAKAKQESDEAARLRVQEKDQTIESMAEILANSGYSASSRTVSGTTTAAQPVALSIVRMCCTKLSCLFKVVAQKS